MGHGFKGDTGHHHTIGENLSNARSAYTYNDATGYFGNKGQSHSTSVRNIVSDDPVATAKDFYDRLTYGGIKKKLENGKGVITIVKDGSVLTFREVSSSDGTPAVDINITSSGDDTGGIKTQKIHFVK